MPNLEKEIIPFLHEEQGRRCNLNPLNSKEVLTTIRDNSKAIWTQDFKLSSSDRPGLYGHSSEYIQDITRKVPSQCPGSTK